MLFRHKKTGGVYRIVNLAIQEADLTSVVVYANEATGAAWVRPASEFFDGRYEVVLQRPPPAGSSGKGFVQ